MQTGTPLLVSLLCLCPSFAFAQDAAAPAPNAPAPTAAPPPVQPVPAAPPPVWNGDFSLGYVKSSGNSSASTLNLKFDLDYKKNAWENLLTGTAFKASSEGVDTDEKYSIGNKLSYNLNPDDYLFGQIDYDYDHYGPITQRYSGSAGYGRHLLKGPVHTLDIDFGLGADRTREQAASEFDSEVIGTFDATYIWKIGPNSQFKQTLRTEFGPNNKFIDPISELKLTIIKNFFAAIDFEIRYNSETPVDTKHTDQITSVNIGYNFGKPPTTAAP